MMMRNTTEDLPHLQRIHWLYRISRVIGLILLFMLFIPLIPGTLLSVPVTRIFALITATLTFQAAAALIGVGLQVDPVLLLAIVTSVAIGVIIGIMKICDLSSDISELVAGWLRSVEGQIERFRFLLFAGRPIGEPVAGYSPIVMNTPEELKEAFREYRNGTFINTTR